MSTEKIIASRPDKKIYVEDGKVIKLFDENYSKSDILNEALNQSRVEDTGIKAPHILEVKKIDGKWAIIMEYIPGKTLAQLMQEEKKRMNTSKNL